MKQIKALPLKRRIYIYLCLFAAFMLIFLWLFQIVFLDDIYRNIKISQIKSATNSICSNVDNKSLYSLMQRFATENQMCISIVDRYGNQHLAVDVLPDCIIHKTNSVTTSILYAQAEFAGGQHLEYIDRQAFRDDTYDENSFFGKVPHNDAGLSAILIYTKIAQTSSGSKFAVIVNSNITPIGATVSTLRTQLLWVTVIMAVAAMVFSLFISSGISKPISEMTASAKKLAKGDYDSEFEGGKYMEMNELAEALNYAAKELQKVDSLKSELIANVSHDLRTPLTMIKGYSEIMRDIPSENTPENLQIIIDETEHLASLVNDMLDLSKLQAGAAELNTGIFSLTDCISGIIARYSALTDKDGYTINFRYGKNIAVNADELKIIQVVYNLINNAINYSGEDNIIEVIQTDTEDKVRIEVSDHGNGIAENELDDIWDRYYKTDASHKRSVVGSGLGLSIVKNILRLHSASFGVISTVGEGSTFFFELEKALTQNKQK